MTVQQRLKRFQEKLLDLSKRNRLLNYRPMTASTVQIRDELPAEVFRLLLSSKRGIRFLPLPEGGLPDDSDNDSAEDAAAAESETTEGNERAPSDEPASAEETDRAGTDEITDEGEDPLGERVSVARVGDDASDEPEDGQRAGVRAGATDAPPSASGGAPPSEGPPSEGPPSEGQASEGPPSEGQASEPAADPSGPASAGSTDPANPLSKSASPYESASEASTTVVEVRSNDERTSDASRDSTEDENRELPSGESDADREDADREDNNVDPDADADDPDAPEPAPRFTRRFQPYDPSNVAERHTDHQLQTVHDIQRLDHNLLRIYQQATSSLEDQGFNTLFLALGALEWYEPDEPKKPRIAPIVLFPVELRRRSPRSPFYLHPTDEDPILNPSLAMKLERELGFRMEELPDDAEEWDLQAIFSTLGAGVESQPGWCVVNDINLGLFSFTKFIMYRDLEAHPEVFERHPLICLLGGEEPDRVARIGELSEGADGEHDAQGPANLDAELQPDSTYQVLDADSSQQDAIQAIKRGESLVLEGPPGTGKSQTITNVVAECLAMGKRILFVSEKMAALEVVYSRLRSVGLADFCLELHSRHTSKRQVAEELGRTLQLALDDEIETDTEALTRVRVARERLNHHVDDLFEPLHPLGLSPFEAIARSAALSDVIEVPASIPEPGAWTKSRLEEALTSLEQLTGALTSVERKHPELTRHPWRGSKIEELSYQQSVDLREALDAVSGRLEELVRAARDVAPFAAAEPPATLSGAQEIASRVELLATSPRPNPESLRVSVWTGAADEVARWIGLCRRFQALRGQLETQWSAPFLELDHADLAGRLKEYRGLLRYLQPGWHRIRRELKDCLREGASLPKRARVFEDLDRAAEAHGTRVQIREADERGRLLFGSEWNAESSDPEALEAFASWMQSFVPHLEKEESRLAELANRGLENADDAKQHVEACRAASEALASTWARLRELGRLDDVEALDSRVEDASLAELTERVRQMRDELESLHEWGRYVASKREAVELGLGPFLTEANARSCETEDLRSAFERLFYRVWFDFAGSERKALRQFSREEHERILDEFRRCDLEQLRVARLRLRRKLLDALPDTTWKAAAKSELGILQREIRRKRGHKPLRKLFQLIPNALSQLKPCFMMSPLSVAQFLDPTVMSFDIVIFDEASQIAPEDAIGAIARGAQLVVVGDSKQLPPTAFFQRQEFSDDMYDSDEDDTPDLESILDEFAVCGLPRRMLRWHYRSRHESLIAFSNQHFYEGRLNTFPSRSHESSELGVEFVYVKDGVFDRSASRVNEIEADRVAQAVLDHFKTSPGRSLGVGTFNQAQQMQILDRLEELRRQDESLEEFFQTDREEHFFVKNLENIQGDERDVIFVSVGYAKDKTGKLYLNFGPLNKTGGERRLNVLMTRARRRLVLFSSIRGSDIDTSRTSAVGVQLFKRYLDFAEFGAAALPRRESVADVESLSLLEDRVVDELEEAGLSVDRRVGFSKQGIGLGVKEHEAASEYVLGIDWDGAMYREGRTARDRDRLRQQVLEGLGWRLHRIWAIDWLRNPRGEVDRVLEAVTRAKENALEPQVLPLLEALNRPVRKAKRKRTKKSRAADESRNGDLAPYELAELDPGGDPDDFESATREIKSRLYRVVKTEEPVHRDETSRRVAACWGITRLGKAVQGKIDECIARLVDEEKIREDDEEFLWAGGAGDEEVDLTPRSRDVEGAPREAEFIAFEEIEAAAVLVLEREFRLGRGDLVSQVAKLLGFSRGGRKLKARIDLAIDRLEEREVLVEDDGGVRRAE